MWKVSKYVRYRAFSLAAIVLSAGLLSKSATSAEREILLPSTKGSFVRCTAITEILSLDHPKANTRNRYKTEFDSFSKLTAWFYPGSPSKLIADVSAAVRNIQADLTNKRMSPEAFAESGEQCIDLSIRTLVKFNQCAGEKGASATKRIECIKLALDL